MKRRTFLHLATSAVAINAALVDPTIVARLADLGTVPYIAAPAELDRMFVVEHEKWTKVIRAAGIKLE